MRAQKLFNKCPQIRLCRRRRLLISKFNSFLCQQNLRHATETETKKENKLLFANARFFSCILFYRSRIDINKNN